MALSVACPVDGIPAARLVQCLSQHNAGSCPRQAKPCGDPARCVETRSGRAVARFRDVTDCVDPGLQSLAQPACEHRRSYHHRVIPSWRRGRDADAARSMRTSGVIGVSRKIRAPGGVAGLTISIVVMVTRWPHIRVQQPTFRTRFCRWPRWPVKSPATHPGRACLTGHARQMSVRSRLWKLRNHHRSAPWIMRANLTISPGASVLTNGSYCKYHPTLFGGEQ